MRDKVKRFISILMTALMLVNLLPVGALAEGVMISNSVQSIGWWPWPEETWPDGSYKIYVYAKVPEGSVGDIHINGDGWYTLGYIDAQTIPSPGSTPSQELYGEGKAQGYNFSGLDARSLIQSNAFHFVKNTNIPVKNTSIWGTGDDHGFKACPGATDYNSETGTAPAWHLNILVNLEYVTPIHRLVFKVENSSGTQIGSKAIEGTWGEEIQYNIGDGKKDVPQTITKDGKTYEIKGKNDNLGKTFKFDAVTKQIEFYYKYKGSVKHTLTINYKYEDGSEAAASHKAELPYQSDYSVESPVIEGYTANNLVVSGTMPAGNVEVTVTYTKNSYSYTVEHYWIGDKDKLDAQPFHTDADENQTALFDSAVAYQENGASWVIRTNPVYTFAKADPEKITITSDPSKNVLKLYYYKNVKLTANSDTLPYNGKEQHVFGYTCAVAEMKDGRVEYVPWTGEKPLTFEGVSASGLGKDVNKDGYRVEFNETPIGETDGLYYVNESQTGTLTITPAPVTLQAPIASKSYDGTPLEATQFGHSYLEGLDFADDFESIILTGSQTLVGSSASLITGVIPKEGKQLKNYNFTFVPGTLTVTDGTGDDPVKPENVVTKTHIPKDMGYNLGEPVTFTISVKNIYNTPKTITLTEKANVKFSNGEKVIVFKDVPAGETVTAEATYTITSNDILAGVFRNTVTAIFGNKSWKATDDVTTAKLDTTLNVTKTSDVPDGQKAALGQKITYTIKVQNAGNVPYTNVKVEDPLTKLTATIETLAVGETRTFTTEYVVTEADVLEGHVLNTATATGDEIKDPKSDEPKEPNGGDEVETPTFAPITIKPKDVTATYNGAAITGKDVEITSGKLLEGHKLSAAVIGSGVNAGSYELTLDPEKIKIVDANNNDVSEMYARTILPGKLIINKRSVLITSQSATKTYDGSALTRPAVTITGDGFVPGELAKAEAIGSITKVGSTPNAIRYTTTGAFNAANYSIALSVGTLTVTEKPKPEPRRTFNLTINYVYQNGKRAAASYNRGGLKNGETFDITSPVIAGYTASETVVSGTIYNRDIKVTVIYTADGVNLDDYGVPLGLGNITMNVGDCFE